MTCKLCGQNKQLIEAHIIPRSFHRLEPQAAGPSRLVTNVEGRYTQKVRKGIYDASILCLECERRFTSWDDYGDQLFLKSWDRFAKLHQHGKHVGYELSSFDYPKLKLFIISVLWRAAVSEHPMFYKVDLGPRESILRQAILNADPGSADHFGVMLQAFDTTEVGILNPDPVQFDGVRFVRLYLAHGIAFVKVDARDLAPLYRQIALAPHTPLRITHKNFLTSPERLIMKRLVVADRERRRYLRRWPRGS